MKRNFLVISVLILGVLLGCAPGSAPAVTQTVAPTPVLALPSAEATTPAPITPTQPTSKPTPPTQPTPPTASTQPTGKTTPPSQPTQPSKPTSPVRASGTVNVVLSPSSSSVTVGNYFSETVSIQAGSVNISAAAASLSFDKTKMSVTSITKGTALSDVPYSVYDNNAGTVDYDAGGYVPFPSSTFTLLTVNFVALAATASTSISFVGVGSQYSPYTDVFDDNAASVIGSTTGCQTAIR